MIRTEKGACLFQQQTNQKQQEDQSASTDQEYFSHKPTLNQLKKYCEWDQREDKRTFWTGEIAKGIGRKEKDKMLRKRRNPSLSICRRYCRLGEEPPCVVCKSISDMGLIFFRFTLHAIYNIALLLPYIP